MFPSISNHSKEEEKETFDILKLKMKRKRDREKKKYLKISYLMSSSFALYTFLILLIKLKILLSFNCSNCNRLLRCLGTHILQEYSIYRSRWIVKWQLYGIQEKKGKEALKVHTKFVVLISENM